MEMDLSFLLVLMISCSFSVVFAEISRKGLRNNDVNQELVLPLGRAVPPDRINPSRVTQLSWRPRVFLYKGFLSDEECDHLISLGHGSKEKSGRSIAGSGKAKELPKDDGAKLPNDWHVPSVIEKLYSLCSTQTVHIFKSNIDGIASRIEERISAWTFLPKAISKSFQFLHFGPEDVKENCDYFSKNSTMLRSESVLATVILYLSNVSRGGQILFPESESGSSKLKNKIWSDCAKSSYVLRPTKGNAILFFNLHPNATLDNTSSHARCPVLEGDMWVATKFFYVKANIGEKAILQTDDNGCSDEDESCPRWAAIGECKRNPVFMIGSPDYYGTCRKSCNAC